MAARQVLVDVGLAGDLLQVLSGVAGGGAKGEVVVSREVGAQTKTAIEKRTHQGSDLTTCPHGRPTSLMGNWHGAHAT